MRTLRRFLVRAFALSGFLMCLWLLPLNTTHAAPIPVTFSGMVHHVNGPLSEEVSHPHSVHASETFNTGRLAIHSEVGQKFESHWGLHAGAHGAWANGFTLRDFKFHEAGKDLFPGGTHLTGPSLNGAVTSPRWHWIFQDANGDDARVGGTVHHLTAVPLPTAVVLLGVGVVSLMALGAEAASSRWKHQA